MYKKLTVFLVIVILAVVYSICVFAASPAPTPTAQSTTVQPTPTPTTQSTAATVSPTPSTSTGTPTQVTQTPTSRQASEVTITVNQPSTAPVIPNEPKDSLVNSAITQSDDILNYADNKQYFRGWKANYAIDQAKSGTLLDFIGMDPDSFDPAVTIVNTLFFFQVIVVDVVIKFVDLAFTIDPTKWLHGLIDKAISDSYQNNFLDFAKIALALVGFYIAYHTIKQNKNKIFSVIVKMIAIIILAEFFFHNSTGIMEEVTNRTNSISTIIASNVFNVSTPDDGTNTNVPVGMAANGIFKEYIRAKRS